MSYLEKAIEMLREDVADKSEGSAIRAFACSCNQEDEEVLNGAIDEYCAKHNLHISAFSTHVYYSLLYESYGISVSADTWCGVFARWEGFSVERRQETVFEIQCDVVDHGLLFLLLAFQDWVKQKNQPEAEQA